MQTFAEAIAAIIAVFTLTPAPAPAPAPHVPQPTRPLETPITVETAAGTVTVTHSDAVLGPWTCTTPQGWTVTFGGPLFTVNEDVVCEATR